MANFTQRRIAAREIFDEALRAVDARASVRDAVRLEPSAISVCGASYKLASEHPVYAIAIGKAASSMASGLEDQIADRISSGFIAGPMTGSYGRDTYKPPGKLSTRWRFCAGEHPLPNRASLTAASSALTLLERASNQRGLLIFLISGGGSALMEWPIDDGITLANLRIANKTLIRSGASISEINAVRRAFSAVKGGRLATYAPNCRQITLIVSDVPQGEEYSVASGPTLTPPRNSPQASEVVGRYDLRKHLPASILRAIDNPAPPPDLSGIKREHFVLLDNDTALDAAATAAVGRGFATKISRNITDGPIEAGGDNLLRALIDLKETTGDEKGADVCLLSGGEFACPVRGDGVGGRNLETALRLAIAADAKRQHLGDFVALCAGTDGIDGNSPFAGAIIDSMTIQRAKEIGSDPENSLQRSDSGSLFQALGDAITTGATGTNVRDLRILLAPGSQNPER